MRIQALLGSCAAAAALAALAPAAGAVTTYQLAGHVTDVSALLLGGGVAVGDPVRMRFTLGPLVADTDPAASVAAWSGALQSWTLDIGSLSISGGGGDVQVCDTPVPGRTNCGSAISYPQFSGAFIGKDAVRFVGTALSSPPLVINGITQVCGTPGGSSQCMTAALYGEPGALSGTAIPPVLDPTIFTAGTGRVPFGTSGQLTYSVSAIPEPPMSTLLLVGLLVTGASARRRSRMPGGPHKVAALGARSRPGARAAGQWPGAAWTDRLG